MAVSRRAFLKVSGVTAMSSAVGALSALGADLTPKVAKAQESRIKGAEVFNSVCPYCAVGCGLLVHVSDGQIVNI